MRLADFITRDMEKILVEWEAFAATLPAGHAMSSPALRDHARQILEDAVEDLRTAQTREEEAAKSTGNAPTEATETAAQTHGALRAESGFEINQMASEYRALRASVLRLWIDTCHPGPVHLGDMVRFNEAIDQALAESIAYFTVSVEEARNLFLGMLGHDMRTPLQSIQLTGDYLVALDAGPQVSEAAARLGRSSRRMRALLDDLIGFNRAQLGLGMPISAHDADMGWLFAEELDEVRTAHPDREIELELQGDLQGTWDGLSIQRLLGNLVVNAIKYGTRRRPIYVSLSGSADEVRFEVRNSGPDIEQQVLDRLFEPLRRGPQKPSLGHPDGGMGLGLHIAREIAKAHGGDISARSAGGEVVFSVRLPRNAPAASETRDASPSAPT